MSWLEFLSVIIPSLSWPVALVIASWLFASELPKLLPRLHKLGPTGLELFPHVHEQRRASGGAVSDLSQIELEPLIDPVAAELESGIQSELQTIPDELRERKLVRALTNAQMSRSFALAYANIFGSQISALEKLNSQNISRDEANSLFLELKSDDLAFWGDLTLDQYLQFLVDWKFIAEENGQLTITPTGRNFLQYLVFSGLSKNRLH